MGTPPNYAQFNDPGRLVYFSMPVRIFGWGSLVDICLLHRIVAGSERLIPLLLLKIHLDTGPGSPILIGKLIRTPAPLASR